MYNIEDVKKYLDTEKFVERPLKELTRLIGLRKNNPDQHQYVAMAHKVEGIALYDIVKSTYRNQVEWRLMQIQDILGNIDGTNMLDAGCGTGLEATFLGMNVGNGLVYATDALPQMVDLAIERSQKHPKSRMRIGECDTRDLPFGRRFFDNAVALSSIKESFVKENKGPGAIAHLTELGRVIKPMGNLVIGSQYSGFLEMDGYFNRLERELYESGFRIITVHDRDQVEVPLVDKLIGEMMVHARKI